MVWSISGTAPSVAPSSLLVKGRICRAGAQVYSAQPPSNSRPIPPIIAITCCPTANSQPGHSATTPVASMPSTRGEMTPSARPSRVCSPERFRPNDAPGTPGGRWASATAADARSRGTGAHVDECAPGSAGVQFHRAGRGMGPVRVLNAIRERLVGAQDDVRAKIRGDSRRVPQPPLQGTAKFGRGSGLRGTSAGKSRGQIARRPRPLVNLRASVGGTQLWSER